MIGDAIRVIRAIHNMDRKEVAELACISYPYLCELEKNQKSPGMKVLNGLANALGVSVVCLLEMQESLSDRQGAVEYLAKKGEGWK